MATFYIAMFGLPAAIILAALILARPGRQENEPWKS